jgi:type III restriction enzyme
MLRNLSEPEAGKVVFDQFRAAINALTIYDSGSSRIEGQIRLRDTRPFRTEPRGFVQAKQVGVQPHRRRRNADGLELAFAVSWKPRPTCRRSARTTWPWASRSTT